MQDPGPAEAIVILIQLALVVAMIAGGWKMLEKANQPGWGVLIPIYNLILLLRVAGKPIWWVIPWLIPLVNVVITILVAAAIARSFGKGIGYTLGLAFLPMIFWPILGFGSAEYVPAGLPSMDHNMVPRAAAIR